MFGFYALGEQALGQVPIPGADLTVVLTATEAQDIASLAAQVVAYIQLQATEAPDTAAIHPQVVNRLTLEVTEAPDEMSFTVLSTTLVQMLATEVADSAHFRTFQSPRVDEDAFTILVPFELQRVDIPPAPREAQLAPDYASAYIGDEWQRVDVDQTVPSRWK